MYKTAVLLANFYDMYLCGLWWSSYGRLVQGQVEVEVNITLKFPVAGPPVLHNGPNPLRRGPVKGCRKIFKPMLKDKGDKG